MSTMLAVMAYAAAMAVPSFLLYRYGAVAWYWHGLSILAALGIGLMPTPAVLATPVCELATGVAFVFLTVWGVGVLVAILPRREKHA